MIPHGGGMIPYQVGRLAYHAEVYGRGDRFAGERLERAPTEYLSRMYFDTVVHEPASLKLLIDVMGEDNVVLGSNYPGWDNAPIWETIRTYGRTSVGRIFRPPNWSTASSTHLIPPVSINVGISLWSNGSGTAELVN